MQIIILNIPADTRLEEVLKFARSGVGSIFNFNRGSKISRCEILDVQDPISGARESHGLVSFDNPVDAQKAITQLNGKAFRGSAVVVKEYHNRSPGDRRITQVGQGKDRPADLRRPNLVVKKRGDGKPAGKVNVLYSSEPTASGGGSGGEEPVVPAIPWEDVWKTKGRSAWRKR